MKTLEEKVVAIVDGERIENPTEGFAAPGEGHIIDCINPRTGRSAIYGQTLEQIRERYPKAERINLEQWCKAKAALQDAPVEWNEITRERYEDYMQCLPPAAYARTFTGFLVGEPSDHHAGNGRPRFQACRIRDGKYWASDRPLTIKEFHGGTR